MDDVLQVWNVIADSYLQAVDQAPHNALYERPALMSLIGNVKDQRVLDLGCGSGYYAEKMLENGAAAVSGLDGSSAMVSATAARTKGKADTRVHDIRTGLPYPDGSFDMIVASLVLHYVEDLAFVAKEVCRVLSDQGTLVASTGHPFADMESSKTEDYYSTELLQEEWASFGVKMPTYRRSLSALITPFMSNGLVLTNLVEPLPLAEMATVRPKSFDKLKKRPGFICLRFQKVPGECVTKIPLNSLSFEEAR